MTSHALTTDRFNDLLGRFHRVTALFPLECLEYVRGLLCSRILLQVRLAVRFEGAQKIGPESTGLDYEDVDVVVCQLLCEAF